MPTKKQAARFKVFPAYTQFLEELKNRVRSAQIKAVSSVNKELISLYWHLGADIEARFKKEGWGTKVIERLAKDLKNAFPEMRGFSPRNLRYMRKFAQIWPKSPILQQPVAKLPWGHNLTLMEKIATAEKRFWYARKCLEHGWSRAILGMQIESDLYGRQRGVPTNFKRTLPAPQSDLAQEALKDPYQFDFLSLSDEAHERDIENTLIQHIREFLLELGTGFAFVGNQVHLEIAKKDFYLDLLFYHLKLRSYVVIELKSVPFQPEFAGKMNFYLSAVDDILRHPQDNPSIGIILCKEKERIMAEYALKDISKPIGVSSYQLTKSLPKKLKGSLPTIEEIEAELAKT